MSTKIKIHSDSAILFSAVTTEKKTKWQVYPFAMHLFFYSVAVT